MRFRSALALFSAMIAGSTPAFAQKTPAAIQTEINNEIYNCGTNCITGKVLNGVLQDIVQTFGNDAALLPGLIAGANITITGQWPNQLISASGGGSGSPGGSSGQIQYNNAGSFGGLTAITNSYLAAGTAALNLGFTPEKVFNILDYGTNVGTPTSSGDDAALSAAEAAACTWGAINGAPQMTNALVYAPYGRTYNLYSQHLVNCQNSYEIQGRINQYYTSGALFVINSVAPTGNSNSLFSFHIASCVQASGGNTSTPTGINSSGAYCVEVASMQFARLFAIDDCRQFSNACVWFNASSNRYNYQNIQENPDIRIGNVGYNGAGVKISSNGSATGAFQNNHVLIADLNTNYHHIDAPDLSTANNVIEFSMEPSVSGGYGFHLGGSYNQLVGRYSHSDVTLLSGAAYNWGQILNGPESYSTVTDSSGNTSNCVLNGGNAYKAALANCIALSFAANAISGAAINGGVLSPGNNLSDVSSISSARTNLGLGALATVTPGTGIAAAAAVNVGSSGAILTQYGTISANDCVIWSNAHNALIDSGMNCTGESAENFPMAVAGATASGGIPYFSNTTTLSTSALLAANSLMIGGGAGTAPSTITTGSGVLTALGSSLNGTGALTATTSPTFVTPILGAASATSLGLTGAVSGSSSVGVVNLGTLT